MAFNRRRVLLGNNYPDPHPSASAQCNFCFHQTHPADNDPIWPRYFCPDCPKCLAPAIPFPADQDGRPLQPWLIYQDGSFLSRPGLITAAAADFMLGAGSHMTNFERLRRITGQIQNIEINVELENRNSELEEIVRELEAKVRVFEENAHIAVKNERHLEKRMRQLEAQRRG
jgi:hypothetical protein